MNCLAYQEMIAHTVRRTAESYHVRLGREDIEDVTQETLLCLWRSKRLCAKAKRTAYVRKAARNATIDLLRFRNMKKRRAGSTRPLEDRDKLRSREATPEDSATNGSQTRWWIQQWSVCIQDRPVLQALYLRYILDWSSVEISEVLGRSSRVDGLLHRARRKIAAHLQARTTARSGEGS